jgi:hypothetical protein
MSSDDAYPWTSDDESEEGEKMPKVFFIDNEEYSALGRMRETVRNLVADVDWTVVNEGWDRKAFQTAIQDIDLFIGRSNKKFQGHLLSGLVKRDSPNEKELMLPKDVRKVRF